MRFQWNFRQSAANADGCERISGRRGSFAVGGLVVASLVSIACSADSTAPSGVTPNLTDAGLDGSTVTDAGLDGSVRVPFVAPADPGKGGFLVTVSGEDLAVGGYEWSPSSKADGDPPAFVDGWALSLRHVLLTVDRLRLNEDPDRDPGDATALGAEVASVDGPFAVDLSVGGNITGKSGSPDEKTVAIAALGSRKDGRPFDPAARYAFSYDLATATASAQRVNLDAEGAALYEQAIAKGWAMVFDGVATYKGPAPAAGSAFAELPQEVRFTLGFKNPASYINCENTDLQAVGEGFPRGLQANANKSTVAQITLHTDHLFWNKLQVEGTPLHFDALAAQAEVDPSTPTKGRLTIEALENVDITNVRTRGGAALPWRSLVSDHTAPAGTVRYDSAGIAFAKTNSLASFLSYSASGGGHLNADGECAIRRNYTP